MTIEKIVTASGEVDVTGSGYRPEGELQVDGRPLDDPVLLDEIRAVLGGGSLANDAVLRQDGGEWTIQGDPTEAAFLVAEAKIGLTQARRERFERVGEIPFTSERKLMSALEADLEREGGVVVVTKGAPDVLLARCTSERIAGEVRPLTDARRAEVLAAVDRLADLALRTLAVAYRPLPGGERPVADERPSAHRCRPRPPGRRRLRRRPAGRLGVRPGRPGTQAADRRRPTGGRQHRGHDR
jgi:magnesium-transporting ATPase (P-type)